MQYCINFPNPELEELMSKIDIDVVNSGVLHSRLNRFLKFTDLGHPIVCPASGRIPEEIIAYSRVSNKSQRFSETVCPHHFVKDIHIDPLWNQLARHIKCLQSIGWTISPDFSMLMDMPGDLKFYNDWRNKFLSALYQLFGIDVIAAPAWADIKDIEHYMDGWPMHSLVAINSTGVCHDPRSRAIWLEGYNAMLDILQPTHILRYGGHIEGERDDISTYYINDNKKGAAYGI